jgi:hypothetical protein
MQRKSHASLDFIKLSPARKTPIGSSVVTSLTTNATTFPALPVAVTQLTAVNTGLANASAAAESGDHVAKANLINAEKTLGYGF